MSKQKLKIIHTADWHLGHHLHGYDRSAEHQAFLDWLLETLIAEQADALLVSGDLFDSANPPAAAWQMLYRFLAEVTRRLPALNVVMVGGNHDSPSKLDAPHELLRAFNLHLIGAVSRDSHGQLDCERLLVPLYDREQQLQGWVLAVPFLRSADLRTPARDVEPEHEASEQEEDRLISGVREIYRQVTQAALAKADAGQVPLLAMGHAYMSAGQLSEMSERRVLGGNQHALPVDIFSPQLSYVALGHLHLAQRVGGQEHIRYSGSPLPLSLAEHEYRHQVLRCEFEGAALSSVTALPVPRYCDMLRLPARPADLDTVLAQLRALDLPAVELARRPYLDVQLLLDKPQALIREKVLAALEDKPVRLAKISVSYPPRSQAQGAPLPRLAELTPEQAFRLCYQRRFDGEPAPQLQQLFSELVQQLDEEELP
ncbi:MAG: exonuclease SbcCD subunit D C-terminal domain-containing protein [Plesiomonas shigelloides]